MSSFTSYKYQGAAQDEKSHLGQCVEGGLWQQATEIDQDICVPCPHSMASLLKAAEPRPFG